MPAGRSASPPNTRMATARGRSLSEKGEPGNLPARRNACSMSESLGCGANGGSLFREKPKMSGGGDVPRLGLSNWAARYPMTKGSTMHKMMLAALLLLSACATNRPTDDSAQDASGPTVYGQVGVSVDHVSTH